MISTLLLIFVLQVSYVTVLTIRTILTIKGYRYYAAVLSAIDVLIYVIGFKLILDNLNQPINLLIYCISYGIGILVGMYVEDRLALGYVNLHIVSKEKSKKLAQFLRDQGFGVTTWRGEGLEGERQIVSITIRKNRQQHVYRLIKSIDAEAFVVSYDLQYYQGGFSLQSFRARRRKNENKVYV